MITMTSLQELPENRSVINETHPWGVTNYLCAQLGDRCTAAQLKEKARIVFGIPDFTPHSEFRNGDGTYSRPAHGYGIPEFTIDSCSQQDGGTWLLRTTFWADFSHTVVSSAWEYRISWHQASESWCFTTSSLLHQSPFPPEGWSV